MADMTPETVTPPTCMYSVDGATCGVPFNLHDQAELDHPFHGVPSPEMAQATSAPSQPTKVTIIAEYEDKTLTITTSGKIIDAAFIARVDEPDPYGLMPLNPVAVVNTHSYGVVSVNLPKIYEDDKGEFFKVEVKDK